MFVRVAAALLLCMVGASAAGPNLSKSTLMAIAAESARDNIGSGWCGRAMLSLLNKAGLGEGLRGNNGQDWEKNLMNAGWKPIPCRNPQTAPLGSVLVYVGDSRVGKRPRGTPGGYYGHVEMVALGFTGQRLYVSDNPRVRPGGSVPDNFTGRAWLPPGNRQIWKAPSIEEQVASVLAERTRMALKHFNRKGEYISLSVAPDIVTSKE